MDCQSTSMAWGETKPLPRQCDSRVAWKEFQFYNDACDVTLACDDGQKYALEKIPRGVPSLTNGQC